MRTKRVTIKDIATEAGVSIALVSFVMNNKADGKNTYRVNKETAQRILEVAQKLNYQPNNAARTLRSGKTNTIGVIVSDISNKFFADIARCIENHAYKHKYTVLFGSTDENPQKLENLVEVFRNKGIDGLIVVPCEGADEIIRDIARQNIPLVLLDREVPDLEVSSVVLNNRRDGYETTEALIRRGFTRIEMPLETAKGVPAAACRQTKWAKTSSYTTCAMTNSPRSRISSARPGSVASRLSSSPPTPWQARD